MMLFRRKHETSNNFVDRICLFSLRLRGTTHPAGDSRGDSYPPTHRNCNCDRHTNRQRDPYSGGDEVDGGGSGRY